MRRITGYTLIVISCIAWLLMPVVPFLDLDATQKTKWLGGLFIFGEVTWWIGVPLLGQEIIDFCRRCWAAGKDRMQGMFGVADKPLAVSEQEKDL